MVKQTYENYFRNYYHLNKDKIKKQTKKYKKSYNKDYYKKNAAEINRKRKEIRDAQKRELETLRGLVNLPTGGVSDI